MNICMDYVDEIKKNVISLFQNDDTTSNTNNFSTITTIATLIKNHEEDLPEFGEFSFPLSAFIWHKHLVTCTGFCNDDNNDCGDIFTCKFRQKFDIQDQIKYVQDMSSAWRIPLVKVKINKEKCFLFLNRTIAYNYVFLKEFIAEDSAGIQSSTNDTNNRTFDQEFEIDTQSMSLTAYRNYLAKFVIRNIQNFLSHKNDEVIGNRMSATSTTLKEDLERIQIHCGPVLDSSTGDRTTTAKLTVKEYVDLRAIDIRLIAMHKYGIRAHRSSSNSRSEDGGGSNFQDLIQQLANATVKIDLLEVKHTNSVSVIKNGQQHKGCTKGAAFILYNSARLETLLRKFNEKITAGDYTSLPSVHQIDFNLLKEEEEWKLFYVYIMQFPHVLKRCISSDAQGGGGAAEKRQRYSIHLLVKFLQGLSAIFSVYYRRIRILTQYRNHLMPTIHARIYLLKAIQEIFNKSLSFLNINAIQYM